LRNVRFRPLLSGVGLRIPFGWGFSDVAQTQAGMALLGSSNLDARSATDGRLVMQKLFDYRASGRAV
jgi:hypothetical protein